MLLVCPLHRCGGWAQGALPLWEQHLTLAYLGKTQDLPDPTYTRCRDAASKGAASVPSVEARVSGVAVLGSEGGVVVLVGTRTSCRSRMWLMMRWRVSLLMTWRGIHPSAWQPRDDGWALSTRPVEVVTKRIQPCR